MAYADKSEFVSMSEAVAEIARMEFGGNEFSAREDLSRACKEGALKSYLEKSKRELDAWEWTQGHQTTYKSNLVLRREALLEIYPQLWRTAPIAVTSDAVTSHEAAASDAAVASSALLRQLKPLRPPGMQKPAGDLTDSGTKRARGPKRAMRTAIRDHMVENVRQGKTSLDTLKTDTEETLRATYGGSRDTVRKARNEAIKTLDMETSTISDN